MRNTTWNRILPGDIVTFIYKSKNQARGKKRWVICMDPKYTYRKQNGRITRFFVALFRLKNTTELVLHFDL